MTMTPKLISISEQRRAVEFNDAEGRPCQLREVNATLEDGTTIVALRIGRLGPDDPPPMVLTAPMLSVILPMLAQFAEHGQVTPTASQAEQQTAFLHKVAAMRKAFLVEGRRQPFQATPSDLKQHDVPAFAGSVFGIICVESSIVLM